MLRWRYILFLLGLQACFGGDAEIGPTLSGDAVSVIGHGGSGFVSADNYYPANSPSSILQAVDIFGADGVEVDIQISADSVLYLYHDDRLEQQTNCQACIAVQESKDLTNCRFRSNFALNITQNDQLWTLEELLADFAARTEPPRINIDWSFPTACDFDFSQGEYFRNFARQLSRLIRQYQAENWVFVELTGLPELEYLQQLHPGLNLVWLGQVDQNRLEIARAKGFWGVVTKNEEINKNLIEEAHRLGLGVILYNVKIRQGMLEALEKGPDMIETDSMTSFNC